MNNAIRLSQKMSDNPKTKTDSEHIPKAAKSNLPQCLSGPMLDNKIPVITAPIAGIPRINPRPFGPTFSMSAA